ncbi:MAG: hypothetical protein IJ364_06230 [Oscillospiraceae bacterium]|nr:hypothetical protein [Oscillospiraceae bacterium]
MPQKDTIKLLRECDAGIKMGLSSIEDVADNVCNQDMKNILANCKAEHEKLKTDIQTVLGSYQDEGKAPNPVAKGMSWMKTNVKLAMDDSDATIADLMTDGCNMGVKSLSRYLNQYKAADGQAKGIAQRLISVEEKLAVDMRPYL